LDNGGFTIKSHLRFVQMIENEIVRCVGVFSDHLGFGVQFPLGSTPTKSSARMRSTAVVSPVAADSGGRTIRIADAHRDDGKRFVVRADEKLTAFVKIEAAVRQR